MKKSMAAAAVLGAFAGSAFAADVQLYGLIDTGVRYLHSDMENLGTTNKFSMESGQQSGSRFGFKGTEDLGNGLSVGFILENQFNSDDGSLKDGLLFRRETSLFLQGGFGKLALGRMGSINGGTSSWGKHGVLSAFGTSWGGYVAQADTVFGNSGLWNNMIAYETPSFGGFKAFAQYGMGNQVNRSGKLVGVENESSSDRYYAVGASYANGPVNLFLSVDSINYASYNPADKTTSKQDDSLTVRFGGNYDFEVAKVFAGAAYFDEVKLSSFSGAVNDYVVGQKGEPSNFKFKGWSLGVSSAIPAAGGKLLVGAAYMDAETADSYRGSDVDLTRWIVSAGYDYPLSKRTNVYGVVTYNRDRIEAGSTKIEPTVYGAMLGLRHAF